MFTEKLFNKIILSTFGILIILISLILIIGEKSSPTITSYEIFGIENDITPAQTQISLNFSRVMDKSSVEKGFKIDPLVEGRFAWIGKKMVFTPTKNLEYGREYTITLSQAQDASGKSISQDFTLKLKTKEHAIFYISEAEKTKGFLIKSSITEPQNSKVVINKPINNYSLSPDGTKITFTLQGNYTSFFLRDLITNEEKEIKITTKISDEEYNGIKFHKLLYGKYTVAILAQPFLDNEFSIVGGRALLLYDLSTSETRLFKPKNGLDDTDTILYTADYRNILYRDTTRNYSYAKIDGTGDPEILSRYLSIANFDSSQQKLLITDSNLEAPEVVYTAYIDNERKKTIVSGPNEYTEDPQFANNSNKVSYLNQRSLVEGFPMFGIVINNLDTTQSTQIYYEPAFSAGFPQWSPDDNYLVFEKYTQTQVIKMLSENRYFFNSIKPPYGEINIINVNTKKVTKIAEQGRDATWDR